MGGTLPAELYQDATGLEEMLSQEDLSWREWPLLASDGDVAALIELVSDHQVIISGYLTTQYLGLKCSSLKAEFHIDTTQAQSARTNIDWNSKKAGLLLQYPSMLLR